MSKMNRPSGDDGAEPQAHDILAAEEFAMPFADPTIHHGPVQLPQDPTGIAEAHDVLAAEEFAMPSLRAHGATADRVGASSPKLRLLAAALLLLLVATRRRAR